MQSNKMAAFELYRALAVLIVILGHFSSTSADLLPVIKTIITSIEPFGVPLFFIISGFLLSASFESLTKNNTAILLSVKIFIFKRVLRIYPAYIVSLILLSLYYDTHIFDFLVHLFNIHNLLDGFNRSINAVYWSLAVEFQWYLISPLIILLFLKTGLRANLAPGQAHINLYEEIT